MEMVDRLGGDMPMNYSFCTSAMIRNSADYPGCAAVDSLGPVEGRILREQPLKSVLREGDLMTYGLSAQGGGERYSFYVAGDRTEEQGVFVNNFFNRTSARANFTVNPSDKLDVAVSLGYTRSNTRLPLNDNASNGWLRNAYRGRPGDFRGGYAVGWRGLGPDEMAIYNNVTRAERFIIGSTVNYQPFAGFRHRLTAGLDAGTRLNTLFYPKNDFYGVSTHNGYISRGTPETRR